MSASSQWAMELSIRRQRDGSQYLSIDRTPLPPKDNAEANEAMRARRMLDESIDRLSLLYRTLDRISAEMPDREGGALRESAAVIKGECKRLLAVHAKMKWGKA